MSYQVFHLDEAERRRQKQASRDHDAERLRRGEISKDDLRSANSFFAPLQPSKFKIVAIGGKPLGPAR